MQQSHSVDRMNVGPAVGTRRRMLLLIVRPRLQLVSATGLPHQELSEQ